MDLASEIATGECISPSRSLNPAYHYSSSDVVDFFLSEDYYLYLTSFYCFLDFFTLPVQYTLPFWYLP